MELQGGGGIELYSNYAHVDLSIKVSIKICS